MKKFGYLYHKIWDIENIKFAHLNARKGKLHYREVQMVNANEHKYLLNISHMLENKTFVNSPYETFVKTDSKKYRIVHKLPYYPDRIIHHAVMQVIEPIWKKTLINDTYSSIKGRGVHKGVSRIKLALSDKSDTQFCLKMDVRQFYPSINHDILKSIISHKIKDNDVLWLLDIIIDSTSGIPIGNYLSQYFGNLYLSNFDHWMKEDQKCKYYFRYCDDIVILDSDKIFLSCLQKKISEYLMMHLKLTIKENWQIFPVDKRGIDFLGYRFFHNYTLLRKSIAIKFKSKIRDIKKNNKSLSDTYIINGIMSYLGWMKFANCYNLQNKFIDHNIIKLFTSICDKNKINCPLKNLNYA